MSNEVLIPTEGIPSVVTSIIRVDGEDIPVIYEVMNITVAKEANKIAYAKITIKDGDPANEDFQVSNDPLFEPGKELEVLVGYEANETVLFKGVIVKIGIKANSSGNSMLKLDCRDKAFKTALVPVNRYFDNMKDSEAMESILSDYDLELEVDASEATHQDLVQLESTDWSFILERAEANGLMCIVNDGKFSIKKPVLDQDPVLTVTYGSNILEFDGEIDARIQYGGVKVSSWDPVNQELLEVEAKEPQMNEAGNLKATDLASVGDEAELNLKYSGQLLQEELQAIADAELLRARLAKIRGRVKFQGFPDLKPTDIIELQGLGDRFNGPVFVSGLRHEVVAGTWQTDVQFGLAEEWFTHSILPATTTKNNYSESYSGLQIGVVTQLQDDPDGEHRILVKLPLVDQEAEGTWARIATLDAGEERGTFFLPEIGDEVVVGFIDGRSRDPIVLGMLHSSNKIAPLEAADDNFEKGYVSKSGIKFLFDDDKIKVQIETPAGKKVVLDEDQGVLQLEDENNNKLVLDSNGILLESGGALELKAAKELKAEGGTDLQLKAGANFKAEGSAGAEVSTSAVAVLKGSLVQIN